MPYFVTYHLNYEQVCKTMGENCPSHLRTERIYTDGSFGTDIWTHFCAMKPVMAGILDRENRSFNLRNNFQSGVVNNIIKPNVKFNKIKDPKNIAFPFKKNAQIDHIFHLGSGYITWLYWDSFNKDGSINPLCNVAPSFVSPESSFQSLHYGIMKTLCDVFGTLNQKKQLEKNMKRLLAIFGKEPSCLKNSEEITKQYFYQAAEQYLE